MTLTVTDLITNAMRVVGAIAIDETPTTSELNSGLITLNVMIDGWSAQSLMLRSSSGDILPLTVEKYAYQIGAGTSPPDFVTAKPINIITAFVRDSTNYDTQLSILTQVEYYAIEDKTSSESRPESIYYDPGGTQQVSAGDQGTIYVYPVPDGSSTYNIHLESDKYLTEFVAITDTVTFEAAYYEALIYNLAMRLFRQFREPGTQLPPDVAMIANESKKAIQRMNSSQIVAGFDLPGKASVYNIYTDQYK